MAKAKSTKSKAIKYSTEEGKTGEKASKSVKYASGGKKSTEQLLYGRDFYIWMLAGVVLIALGFLLMAGGNQAPGEWNADEIYSFRRTGLAPIVIMLGLGVEIYAIFKK